MTPDADGRVRGIVVGRVWPGHRDYDPPPRPAESPRALVDVINDRGEIVATGTAEIDAAHYPLPGTFVPSSCGVEVDAIPCFSGCACTCGTDFPCPCECHPDEVSAETAD